MHRVIADAGGKPFDQQVTDRLVGRVDHRRNGAGELAEGEQAEMRRAHQPIERIADPVVERKLPALGKLDDPARAQRLVKLKGIGRERPGQGKQPEPEQRARSAQPAHHSRPTNTSITARAVTWPTGAPFSIARKGWPAASTWSATASTV